MFGSWEKIGNFPATVQYWVTFLLPFEQEMEGTNKIFKKRDSE